MLEGGADLISTDDLKLCIKRGTEECKKIIDGIMNLRRLCGKTKQDFTSSIKLDEEKLKIIRYVLFYLLYLLY